MKRWSKIGLGVTLVIYATLAFAMSRVTPFNKGPDEETNLAYTEFIIKHDRLPITYEEREQVGKDANWPALYHLLVAYLSKGLGIEVREAPYIKIFWDSFRYQAVDAGEEWYYLRTEDQEWPYYGRILVLHLGRWLSILFGVVTLILVYQIVLEILPGQAWLALVTTAFLAFIPMFIFMSAVMNEDTFMAALAALYFWLVIRIIKYPGKTGLYWAAGLVLGLSITVKYTTIILPIEVVLIVAAIAWRQVHSQLWAVKHILIVGFSAVLASSWWFGWNFWFLNKINDLGLISGLLYPIFASGPDMTLSRLGYFFSGGEIGLGELPEERQQGLALNWAWKTFLSFWAVTMREDIPLASYAYPILALVLGAAIFGLWRLWWQDNPSRRWLLLLLLHGAVFLILPLLRFNLSRRIGETAQGRHILMPATAAVAILVIWGLARAMPQRWQQWGFSAVIAGLIAWTGTHYYGLATIGQLPVPLRTIPQAATWLPNPINVRFGEAVELVSYELTADDDHSSLHLTLAWRSLAHTSESYLLKVRVVDSQGKVISHWLGYNGQGRLPTLAWDPGDSIFDRLILPLPGAMTGTYQVQIELVGYNGPLALNNDAAQGDILSLGPISLQSPAPFSFPHRLEAADPSGKINFALWGANGPVEAPQDSVYRYPATISLVVSGADAAGAKLNLTLIDSEGRERPATQTEANIYTFVIGPDWSDGAYRVRLTLWNEDKVIAAATGEPLLEVENWWERQFKAPQIETPLEANFADQLRLLGYKLPQRQIKAGEAFPITLYWQAPLNRSPQTNFIQFNHLLDSTGQRRGGYDRQPLEYYSTLLWAPGEVVVDGYAVPVDADAPPGEYYLNVGYYLTVGESAVTLPLVVDGQMTETGNVTIGPIQVIH